MTKKDWYVSSTGSGLSWTVAGFSAVGATQLITQFLNALGINFFVGDELGILITNSVQVAGGVVVVFGILRKVYYRVKG